MANTLIVGAEGAPHWAFQPVVRPEAPAHRDGAPRHDAIDAFVGARLVRHGLTMAPPADSRTLLRRLYLDMHGLPPTPEEVAEFISANDPEAAYEAAVDAVLDSPRYGERWAQHWLDLVRYADTHGFEVNTERPNAWPYRDYVIRALNEDRPYDQFIVDQLAGDTTGEDAATGFLVASAVLLPGQIGKDAPSKRLARQEALDEIVVATGDTFLAMSIGCSRCHDHKFDPVPQRDYYAMQAFFAGVEYGERPIRDPDAGARLAQVESEIAIVETRLDRDRPLASDKVTVIIDDEDQERTATLTSKSGHGVVREGSGRGQMGDPGAADRPPNLGKGRYTTWENSLGEDVFEYRPGVAGRFRIWLSWGVRGDGVQTRDARYAIDLDGDLATRDDQREVARVDQNQFAGASAGELENGSLWSGLLDVGVHELGAASRITLRSGDTSQWITADVIVLQAAEGASGRFPGLRAPVSPGRNVERFAPLRASAVRFTALSTIDDNKHEPCIDELQIYDTEGANVAPSGTPRSSGDRAGDPQHQLAHINDDRFGNARSWISDRRGTGWVQIDLGKAVEIDRVVWGRDREGKFRDRLANRYRVEVSADGKGWITVASSGDRAPHGTPFDPAAAVARLRGARLPTAAIADQAELERLNNERAKLISGARVFAGSFRQPDVTYLLNRGDPEQKGERVAPAVPAVLGSLTLEPNTPEQQRRLALARWIASPRNPLTARVMVNRIWQYHFGRGLVDTPSDFGVNGALPSHPELLDWLAAEFVGSGWSIKQLHRLILLSATYRQSGVAKHSGADADADCRLLWRFPTRRLEAEAIRDGILAVSGKLNLRAGGPGFDLFGSRGGLNGFPPIESFGPDGLRRMIYAHKVRMERSPVFGAFDCPDAGRATPRRRQSTTAIQALNLFNSQFVVDQARAFAGRVEAELGSHANVEAQIRRAFQLAYCRDPGEFELATSTAVVRRHGLAALCRALYNSNEFLFMP